jgi:type I restriction enzyme, S subunit
VTASSNDGLIGLADLPASWEVSQLGEVITDVKPGFASGVHNEEGRGVPHLRPNNITLRGTISLDRLKYVETEVTLRATTNDVLFNNTNSSEHIGKSAVLNLAGEWGYSNHLTRLRMPDELIADFVALQLHLLWRIDYFRIRARRHVNQVSISLRELRAVPLLVPPIQDQRQVVEHVRSRHEILDSVESSITSSLDMLTVYEHKIIESAATGTLLQDHHDKVSDSHWKMTTVNNVGAIQLGKKREPKSHIGPNMTPYLRVANVLENEIDITDVHEMNFTPSEFEKYRLISGDILLNEGQSPDLVGRPAMFRGEIDNCCFQMTLIRFRSNNGISPTFALLVFRYYLHSGRFRQAARWSTNIAHLTAIRFAALEFPDVSLAEQESIAEEATRRLDSVATLRDTLDDILARASVGRDMVLAEAFHVRSRSITEQAINTQSTAPADDTLREEEQMSADVSRGRSNKRRSLLEVLQEDSQPSANRLFAQAGFTKDSVDEFYEDLRGLVRSGVVAERRTPDNTITLHLVED